MQSENATAIVHTVAGMRGVYKLRYVLFGIQALKWSTNCIVSGNVYFWYVRTYLEVGDMRLAPTKSVY